MVPTFVWLVGLMFKDLNIGLDGLSNIGWLDGNVGLLVGCQGDCFGNELV